MRAIGYTTAGPVSAETSVVEFETETPQPGPHDLLVEVLGVSVNPVDVKVRANRRPPDGAPQILGFDAAGIVRAVGSAVTRFKPGDEVFHAGEITRPGTNAEFHLVDERIAGRKPTSLGFAEAAAMPLTSITAWELLFDSFGLREGDGSADSLLVIGGAGGVGSILTQLAKKLTGLTVIATASRPESIAWAQEMGADHVVDHHKPLDEGVSALGLSPRFVAALTHTDKHYPAIIELIKPRGHIAIIDDPQGLDISAIKLKALTFSWEFMFARSMFRTEDMDEQHNLLNRIADLVDDQTIIAPVNQHFGNLSVASLRSALELQDSGAAIGKTVMNGFG